MTIYQDLIKVYDDNQDQIGVFEQDHFEKDYTLLPASHVSVNIQIEVTITQQGKFGSAQELDKPGIATVIPATIESATRASNIDAHPLQDKVKYVAYDYPHYAKNDKRAEKYYPSYIRLLKAWATSDYANNRIKAIYYYQQQHTLIQDLIDSSVIKLEQGQINKKYRDAYVRFNVLDDNPVPVWQDRDMYASWIDFYNHLLETTQPKGVDYLTGKTVPTTKLSEKNINPATSGAKLISANDKNNFTYRGLFLKDDFYSVGYLESQKMAHALKWLIQRQGLKSDSRVFLFWSSSSSNDVLSHTAQLLAQGVPAYRLEQEQAISQTKVSGETGQAVATAYNQRLLGMTSDISYGQPVYIIFLDAATTGRMATVYYNSMDTTLFRERIETWAKNCGFIVNNGQKQYIHTPTINQLIKSAYLVGRGGKRYETLKKRAMSRSLVSIINAQPLPEDLLMAIYRRLLTPRGYEDLQRWRYDLFNYTAALNYNQKGGKINMALNLANHDRSYLFGRLLAIADDIESRALYRRQGRNANVSSRLTTAQRFMTNFSERPATTWQRIYLSIMRSYIGSLSGGSQHYYQTQIAKIIDILSDQQMNDEPLKPMFLSGFAAQHVENQYQNEQNNKKTQEESK